jgi:four helix bundle protein
LRDKSKVSRNPRKLQVFLLGDELALKVYAETAFFPAEERFGLCQQIRRASISVPANIVEGCARRTTRDYLHFINIATGSAAETLYLLGLAAKLGFLRAEVYRDFDAKYNQLMRGLQKLISSLEGQP